MFGIMHITSRTFLKGATREFPTRALAQEACERMNLSCSNVYYEAAAIPWR